MPEPGDTPMTQEPPLVSVVIPTHNYARFLGEAIESALGQTHRPIEVLVVDDGSSDNPADVAKRYPVTLLTQPRRGVCTAINFGVQASHGPFVMRLDADDILEPTYVEETLAALESRPSVHFAYTQVEYFGAASGTYPVEDYDPESLAERNYIHGSALMRRTAFDRVGGYDEKMGPSRCEDWDLWLAFAERGLDGVLVPRQLLRYRQHAAQSRSTLNWGSGATWKRNLVMAGRLQSNHPRLFAPSAMALRLGRLPNRLIRGDVSMRFAILLASLYATMLVHVGLKQCLQRRKATDRANA